MRSEIKLDDLKPLVKNLKSNYQFDEVCIYCHPDNIYYLNQINKELSSLKEDKSRYQGHFSLTYPYDGVKVITDSNLEKFTKRWEFPKSKNKFYEYNKEDEVWAIPIKHGKWVYDDNPVFFLIKQPSFRFNYNQEFYYNGLKERRRHES